MILRKLSVLELEKCLKECQKKYDNNLMFNRFDISGYIKNSKGIEAQYMDHTAIIAKDNGKPVIIPVYNISDRNKEPIQNPLVFNQEYRVVKYRGEQFMCEVWYKGIDTLHMSVRATKPKQVVDFLKNNINPNQITFTLRVQDSKKAGHKTGHSTNKNGNRRRLTAACWHVHRDVMKAIFEMNPEANLKTAMAHYKGKDDFYDKFEETGYKNVGSEVFPAAMEDMCECSSGIQESWV